MTPVPFSSYLLLVLCVACARGNPRDDALSPMVWRREHRIVDMHMHIEGKPERFDRAVRIMNSVGIGQAIELGSGTVTRKPGKLSDFERTKQLADANHPGRFLHYMLLDYTGWDQSDWSEQAARQIEEGHRLGAAGLKEFKRLGLSVRDGQGKLVKIDDPKLDAVWAKCAELGMPVSIHVGDPKAFWEPLGPTNERWSELKDHPNWWFGNPAKHPLRMELLEALSRVIGRHPTTRFVAVHFANNAEDLGWVDQELSKHSNMMADFAARIPEVGRHPPEKVRELILKYPDRFLFGTDFQVYERLTLGSAGDDERPTDADAQTYFRKCWRFFETDDRDWVHMTPIQGDWKISSIHLPPQVQRKIYFDNARKLLARSWPLPTMKAAYIDRDFEPDGILDEAEWSATAPARMEYQSSDASAWPELSTAVRALWSNRYLYLAFECPFTKLSTRSPKPAQEQLGLWEDDVVEVFIAPNAGDVQHYYEFEWAPNGEQLDVQIHLSKRDFEWNGGAQSAIVVDEAEKIWRVEVRIPLRSISSKAFEPGARWRMNLFRHDRANRGYLAWSPTLGNTFHVPQKFGWLEFAGETAAPNEKEK